MLLVDAHVHIYDCFDLTKFFDSAYSNFKSVADRLGHGDDFIGILLLAETSRENWFHHLSDYADGKSLPGEKTAGTWKFHPTDEPETLYAKSGSNYELILIAGRQIITEEGLELLALGTTATFNDGTPIGVLTEIVQKKDGLPVIPWGFGKWIGRRGAILKNLIQTAKDSDFFLGDNSGRPFFWPRLGLFKQGEKNGIRVLPGSDPLPVAEGYKRTGSFGFFINKSIPDKNPSTFIKKELMLRPHCLQAYGKLEGLYPFIRNQIAVRFRDR